MRTTEKLTIFLTALYDHIKRGVYYSVIAIFSLQTSLVLGANWNAKAPDKKSKPQSVTQEWIDINHSTSRYSRSQKMCRVATQPNSKPAAKGLDHFLMQGSAFVYADLYGDGSLELISMYSDETFDAEKAGPAYKGSKFRSRNRHPYMVFSPTGEVKLPENAQFLMAVEMIAADFNNDKKEDVVFVQHGPDYAPYVRMRPDILLSQGNEYVVNALPGEPGLFHGGAAGDIDRDGDIDIVAGPGKASRTIAYINDGEGRFSYKEIIGSNSDWKTNEKRRWGRHALWDLDGDGYLDLIAAKKGLTSIYWGKEKSLFGGYFDSKPVPIEGTGMEHTWIHDFEFGDFDQDGVVEMAMLSSLRDPQNVNDKYWGEMGFYSGYAIYYVNLSGRSIESVEEKIFELPISTRHFGLWLDDFTACDLENDGDLDFVHEIHGEKEFTTNFIDNNQNHWGLDKLVWLNDGVGNLEQKNIPSPIYHPANQLEKIYAVADELGISNRLYEPKIIFNPTPNGKRYFERSEMIPEGVEKATRLNLLGLAEESQPKQPQPKVDVLNASEDLPSLDMSKPPSNATTKQLCQKAIYRGEWNKFAPFWRDKARGRGIQLSTCVGFEKNTKQSSDKANNAVLESKSDRQSGGTVNRTDPDGTIPTKDVCDSAIYNGAWNSNSPKWVAEAKRRGLSAEMCKVFTQ